MTKLAKPTDKKSCAAMLADIEADLLTAIPSAVRKKRIREPAYGLLVCYIDLTTDEYTPFAVALPESHRQQCIANREAGAIWAVAEVPATRCDLPAGKALNRRCNLVYQYLDTSRDDQKEEEVLRPFREMIYRVCRKLNALDWSAILPVAKDFVVMASDWSGFWVYDDSLASVPARKQQALKRQGLFFNPRDLPKPKVPAGNPIARIGKKPAAEQLPFWISQMDALAKGEACDASKARWGVQRVVDALVKLGEPGGEALLAYAGRHAGDSEWKDDGMRAGKRGPQSDVLCRVMDGIENVRRDGATEKRLWTIFEKAVKANKEHEIWGGLPRAAAFCIYHTFNARYDFWVITDFQDKIMNLKDIRKQARERSGSNYPA